MMCSRLNSVPQLIKQPLRTFLTSARRPSICQNDNKFTLVQRMSGLSSMHSPIHSVPQFGLPLCFSQSQRFYNRKKTIRIPPTKPLTFEHAGDLDFSLPSVDPNAPKPGFEDIEELQNADDKVKAILSMRFADGCTQKEKRLNWMFKQIQEHPADIKSLEVEIARLTVVIRNQIRHMLDYRKDKVAKRLLVKRISTRHRHLHQLRTVDMEKFEWLTEQLKIQYRPPKTKWELRPLSRRAARKKAARDGFFTVKKQKMQALREKLAVERETFEREKEEELSRLDVELKEMGITEYDSLDDLLRKLGMDKYIEKPERRMKRRYLILQRKFELHKQRELAKAQEAAT